MPPLQIWPLVHTFLTDKGLKSVSASEVTRVLRKNHLAI